MAVDIQYYFNSILNKEDANLFNRYFSKYNFKNLISASSFFKHLQKDDLKWIYDEDDRGKIYNKAYEVGSKLKEVSPSLKEIYEEQWTMASDSARDKASYDVVPGGYQYL